jgi:phage portal protein BeeE
MNLFKKMFGLGQKGTQPDYSSLINAAGMPQVKEINGTLVPYADNRTTYLRSGYQYNDIVYMVIKTIVDKACIPAWAPYDVVDETALKEYHQLRTAMRGMQDAGQRNKAWNRLKDLHHKSLKPAKDDRLIALLESPNPESNLNKLHSQLWTSKLSLGGYTENWFVPSGGLDGGYPVSLEWLPYNLMDIYTNRENPLRITGYQLNAWNLPKYLPDEILHESYANMDWSEDGRHFYGMSPLKASLRRLQRNNESQISGVRAFQNGGVRGITYLDIPSEILVRDFDGGNTADEVNALKARYEAINAGGSIRAGSTTFSGYKVGFTATGLSPVDLDQMAIEKWDMRMIAATYSAPSQLFNDPDNKTFANEAEGNKALILRSCLPLLNDREAAFNQKLRKLDKYKNGRRVVTYDIKQYTELEENKKDMVGWLKQADWLTFNEKRDQMGFPLRTEPEMDKIYVPSSLTPIEDLGVGAMPDEGDEDESDLDNQNDDNGK